MHLINVLAADSCIEFGMLHVRIEEAGEVFALPDLGTGPYCCGLRGIALPGVGDIAECVAALEITQVDALGDGQAAIGEADVCLVAQLRHPLELGLEQRLREHGERRSQHNLRALIRGVEQGLVEYILAGCFGQHVEVEHQHLRLSLRQLPDQRGEARAVERRNLLEGGFVEFGRNREDDGIRRVFFLRRDDLVLHAGSDAQGEVFQPVQGAGMFDDEDGKGNHDGNADMVKLHQPFV